MMYLWTILGALVLAGAIGWAMLNNKQSRRGERRTEQATRELYREQDAADKAGDSGRSD